MQPGRIIFSIAPTRRGVHAERWLHAHGCQRWFNMLRDTASDQVIGIYAMGESRPDRAKT